MVFLTTEEKLEHFQNFCMEDARTRSAKMLDEYSSALEATFKEHQSDALRRAEMLLNAETANLKREINRQLSVEQIGIKRTLGQKQEELKNKIFTELRDMLANFMETNEYEALLESQIASAKKLAGEEPLIIYLDPADEDKLNRLALHHNADIRVSEYSFSGGCRAVIPSKNILIDHSFESKLAEAKSEFQFDLREAGGEIHG